MNRYVGVIVALALNGCATSASVTPDTLAAATVDTLRTHVRAVRDHVRAGREALGLRERSRSRGGEAVLAGAVDGTPADDPRFEPAPAVTVARHSSQGHPARDAALHEIRMDVAPAEMLTATGTLQPRAAQALARMARMARDSGGEFTVTVPRTRIETAAAIRAAAPEATILSSDDADGFRLVVVTEEH